MPHRLHGLQLMAPQAQGSPQGMQLSHIVRLLLAQEHLTVMRSSRLAVQVPLPAEAHLGTARLATLRPVQAGCVGQQVPRTLVQVLRSCTPLEAPLLRVQQRSHRLAHARGWVLLCHPQPATVPVP